MDNLEEPTNGADGVRKVVDAKGRIWTINPHTFTYWTWTRVSDMKEFNMPWLALEEFCGPFTLVTP